jgi:hypothetical protein
VSVANSGCNGTISGSSSITVNVNDIPSQNFVMGFRADNATANSNSKVTFWDNFAGSGSNFPDGNVNTTSDSYRPTLYPNYAALNNHAGVYFDGGDQPVSVQVNTASGISGGTQKSLYILYRSVGSSLSTNRMVIYKQGDENHGLAIYLINRVVYYGLWNNQNCAGSCSNKWSVFQNTGFTMSSAGNYIMQLVYNGNASSANRVRFSINGTVYTPSTTAGTSMDYSGDAVSIGGKVGNTRFHDAASVNETSQYNLNNSKLAEVLLFNTADASIRNQVWCVLKNKYAISTGENPVGALAKSFYNDDDVIAGERPTASFSLSEAQPNPSSDFANFTLAVDREQLVRMTVLNELGQEIMLVSEGMIAKNSTNGFTLNASQLPSGMYILRVKGEDFETVRQFVVVK